MLSDLLEKYGGGTRLCLFFKKKSVSVFANGNGGKLIFGVADDDTITGLGDVRHDSEVISEQIKSRIDPIPKFDLVIQTVDT